MDRFQKWCPDFNDPFAIGDNHRLNDLIPLQNITKVPVALVVAKEDTVATTVDAQWTMSQIGPMVVHD